MKSEAYCGECSEMMKSLPDNSIDLTVTSPPYDDLRTYKGYVFNWENVIKELYRVMCRGGVVVWIVNDGTENGSETGTSFKQALYAKECGFNLHDTMIWKKECSPFPERNRYYQNFEYMFVWSKGKPKTFNPIKDRKNIKANINPHSTFRDKTGKTKKPKHQIIINEYGSRFNVWEVSTEKANKSDHPAVFPIKLVKDHIITWSNEGDTVLDPFLGSGTTRIAAHDLNRNFIGYEISREYFDKQEERYKNHAAQMTLYQYMEGVEI